MPKSNELERSRPFVMLKLDIIVTLSMMEAIFASLHKKNTLVIKIKKWQIVLIEGLFRVAIRGIDHQQLPINQKTRKNRGKSLHNLTSTCPGICQASRLE